MKYDQILALLDKGFTPEQVMALQSAPDPVIPEPQPEPQSEQVPQQEPAPAEPVQEAEPEWAKKLNDNIQRMTNAIHAQNIAQDISGQGSQQPETAEQILTGLIK